MIFVVFQDQAAFDAFKADFPSSLVDPDTLLGVPVAENADGTGRLCCAHHYNAAECAMLQLAGAELRVGAIDGPLYGEDA